MSFTKSEWKLIETEKASGVTAKFFRSLILCGILFIAIGFMTGNVLARDCAAVSFLLILSLRSYPQMSGGQIYADLGSILKSKLSDRTVRAGALA